MKTLFKKRETPFVYHAYYDAVQTKWAQKMDVLVNGLSRRKQISLLVLFTILTGSYLVCNIYTAFSKGDFSTVQNTAVLSKIKTINSKK